MRKVHGGAIVTQYMRRHQKWAEDRQIPWLIKDSDARLILTSDCEYCGAPYTEGYSGFADMADPTLGMTRDNLRATCQRCHWLMRSFTCEGEMRQYVLDMSSSFRNA